MLQPRVMIVACMSISRQCWMNLLAFTTYEAGSRETCPMGGGSTKILHRTRRSAPNHLKLWNRVRNYVGLDWKKSWVDAGPPVMLTISWAQITCSRPNQKFRQIPVWWHNDCQTLFQHETKVTNRLRIHWDKFLGLFPPRTLLRTDCSRQEVIVANDRIPWNKKSIVRVN